MAVKRIVLRLGLVVFALTLAVVALVPQQARADTNYIAAARYASGTHTPWTADAATMLTVAPAISAYSSLYTQSINSQADLSLFETLRIQNFQARFTDTLMDSNFAYPCPAVYLGTCVIAPALTVTFDTSEASRPLVMLTVGSPQVVGSPGVPPGPSGTVYPPGAVTTVTAANSTFFYMPKEAAPTTHHVLVLYPRMAPAAFYSGNPVCGARDPQAPYKAPHCTLTPNQTYWGQTWASIWDDVPSAPTQAPATMKLF